MPQNNIYTVQELNQRIQELISGEPWLGSLCVEGEITGFGRDKKGHCYFSLKDSSGVVSAVMFAGKQRFGLGFTPKNGDKVHAFGRVEVYVRDGKYQLYVDRLVRVGDGEVNANLQKLIAKLEGMGLFSQEYKKPIPPYPRRIGVVTAGHKAAISDICKVAETRDPYAQLYCYPATVQGQYAAADISRGIEILDNMNMDVIIVGRGGGSEEDLWAFNEEQVAWAIFNAETPIITATGHEINTTIADMVADRRESNPSTAVMHALPVVKDTVSEFEQRYLYIKTLMENRLERYRRNTDNYARQLRLLSPDAQLDLKREKLMHFREGLDSLMNVKLNMAKERCSRAEDRMTNGIDRKYEIRLNALAVMTERLHGLSPTAKLINGFGYIAVSDQPVTSVSDVEPGNELEITLHDGKILASVTDTNGQEE